jgi:transcriptional regulator with XRE-family HTH domain
VGEALSAENLQLTLALVGVATDDVALYRKRRGHWLRIARQQRGLTLKEVAHDLGYSQRSATTIKLWEDGLRDLSDVRLRRLAEVYAVPVEVFTEPDETDDERLSNRVRAILAERARRNRSAG